MGLIPKSEIRLWEANPNIPRWIPAAAHLIRIIPTPPRLRQGAISLLESNAAGAGVYVLGRVYPEGHPLYFLIALGTKVPVSLQILFATALILIALDAAGRRAGISDFLWLVPPLVLILPPLIWGWLTYRVFAYDALAQHASSAERKTILREHRGSLLVMGILSGYLGAAPSLLWASGAMFVALAPLLVPVAIWIYTLVFAFASLWFAHFTLAALQRMRAAQVVEVLDPEPGGQPAMPLETLQPTTVLPPPGA